MSNLPPKIALAQINVTVGDILGNSAKILSAWKEANEGGAEIVIFPELCVTGYPPEDLILMPEFRVRAMQSARNIAEQTKVGAALIIGCPWEDGEKTYNAALLIDGEKIIHIQPKTCLPNYGIFDEKRLFSPGNGTIPITWRGNKIAILICEDIWHEEFTDSLAGQNLDAVFVINASPFETGKQEQRIKLVSRAANKTSAPFFYVNLVGGQDDIVFDGGSFVAGATGEIFYELPRWQESVGHESRVTGHESKEDEILNAMKLGLADYVCKNGFSKVLLGLSGGIDSALTAAVAADALGSENVLGVLLPSPYSSQGSIDDALETARLLGIKTKIIPISSAMEIFSDLLTPELEKQEWMENAEIGGNLQARLRGIILMALSNASGAMLLSTGNKSEIAVGYSTLYGDSCGGYNVLKDIYKTQVYKLANRRNALSYVIPENSINKAPSAELKPGQLDEDNLPPYPVLDDILEKHIEGRLSAAEIIASGHKKDIVEKVLRLVHLSEYKRRQSCPGVKISPMMFGKDRRYPLTNKF